MAGDIILISLREFQDERADIIHKYTADEARNLKTYGELKSDFQINEAAQGGDEGSDDDEGGVEFEEADIDDICAWLALCEKGQIADAQNVAFVERWKACSLAHHLPKRIARGVCRLCTGRLSCTSMQAVYSEHLSGHCTPDCREHFLCKHNSFASAWQT